MRNKILTIFRPRDYLAEEVKKELLDKLEDLDVLVDLTSSAAEAENRLQDQDYELVIAHMNIPADSRTTNIRERGGVALLKSVDSRFGIPSILFVREETLELFQELKQLRNSWLTISEGSEDWKENLVSRARYLIESRDPPARRREDDQSAKKVNLDISAAIDKTTWDATFKITGGKDMSPRPIPLQVNQEAISKALKQSKRVDALKYQHPLWEEQLQDIADELMKVLFSDNEDFRRVFDRCKDAVGGLEKFSIRFNLQRQAHPLILEALATKEKGNKWDYWMLKAPIYRSLLLEDPLALYEKPLFSQTEGSDDQSIRCLIIESNVSGYIENIEKELEVLTNIHNEADFIEKFLSDHRSELNIESDGIRRIPGKRGEICTRESVQELLTRNGPWDLVHYAGHSFFDSDNEMGFVFFPGDKEIGTVDIGTFSAWLRMAKTRFIYLSSCHSSEEEFVFELVKNRVPSVLGFRWDIDDLLAEKHTERFYNHLRKNRSLEHAFLNTRKDMHNDYIKEIIWAAPVLIMQMR